MDGKDCLFLAVVFNSKNIPKRLSATPSLEKRAEPFVCHKFIEAEKFARDDFQKISLENSNFGFNMVASSQSDIPDKPAMIHLDKHKVERHFTFKQMKVESARTANYFKSLGIKKGDRVMLVLKRHYQFWFAIVALHKVVHCVPQQVSWQHDFDYRFRRGGRKRHCLHGGAATSRRR